MVERLTEHEKDALRRIADQNYRYRHLPGHGDGIELGDWTAYRRLIDPDYQATRGGRPDAPGTYPPGSIVIGPDDRAVVGTVFDEWRRMAKRGGFSAFPHQIIDRLAALVDRGSTS